MSRSVKIPPIEAFNDSLDDAAALVDYASAFKTKRARKMRTELRDRIGVALRRPTSARHSLDCIESDSLFVVFFDSKVLGRERFQDLRPLLRQAVVAVCAALESYVADKAIERLGATLAAEEPPRRILDIALTVGQWLDIEDRYKRRIWGVRSVVESTIREQASTSPSRIGEVLSMVGVEKWAGKIDKHRKIARGTTVKQLDCLTARRNRIAHAADRVGQGRAQITIDETRAFVQQVKSIVLAIEATLATE